MFHMGVFQHSFVWCLGAILWLHYSLETQSSQHSDGRQEKKMWIFLITFFKVPDLK